MGTRARTLPMLPLVALPELTAADGLIEEPAERSSGSHTSRSGRTLIGAGPRCTPDRTVGVGITIQVGDLLAGKYEALSLLGAGAASFVMAAFHRGFDSEVALKFFNAELVGHEEARRRFAVELRSNLRLRSEHIVRVFDVDRLANGQPFLVMERLRGYDLRVALGDRGRLGVERSLEFALQICEALATAHTAGIVHLDLKPENLFVTGMPHAELLKVLDFGSCREQHESSHRVATLSAQGSPPYMSPEQMRGSAQLDERSDIWSLGCVLYEMLSGRSPFLRPSLPQACAAVLEEPVSPLRALRPELPGALESVVLRCLEKNPDHRPQSALALAEALLPFAPHCTPHVRRCRQIMEEHGSLRVSGVQLLAADRMTLPAPPPAEMLRATRLSQPERREPERREPERREPERRARSQGPALRQLVGAGVFVLACYASLRPSPRLQRAAPLVESFAPGSMCEQPAPPVPPSEPLESVAPPEQATPALSSAASAAELRRIARRARREQARKDARAHQPMFAPAAVERADLELGL